MAKKNLWAKTRPSTDPYFTTYDENGWTWKILKAYKCRESEKADPYARWFCLVTSPMTSSRGDLGDVYCNEVPLNDQARARLAQREVEEARA